MAGVAFVLLVIIALVVRTGGGDGRTTPEPGGVRTPSTVPAPDTGAGGNSAISPLRLNNGVPVGYPHSCGGATWAAVNFEVARSSASYFTDAETRHRVIDAIAARSARDSLTRNDDTGMKQVLSSLGITAANRDTLVARAAALGTRTVTCSPAVATVDVWMAGLVGATAADAPLPVSASWATYTLTLQWEDADWRLTTVSSVPGPTPLDTGGDGTRPSSTEEFRTADRDFDAPPYIG
ncbi:hypothetical protein SAMN05216251_12736 [Actinacidiphila alni]|uniref:DUF8175 domain-containing protein n=1 Tax=Actinacidiphila alni TaxID=380248 RepID=A0A1I2L7K6_9ACTN|nr:hypothetical protein [Actinacidiphila alni]SFF74933.1 hypothetical protein SAMN05216251_12736 [Actinacidiphila alni]